MKRRIGNDASRNMKRTEKTETQHEPRFPPVMELTELSQLEKISHGEPLLVDVVVRGQPVRFVGRRLKVGETKEVKLLLERALPPLMAPEGGRPGPV